MVIRPGGRSGDSPGTLWQGLLTFFLRCVEVSMSWGVIPVLGGCLVPAYLNPQVGCMSCWGAWCIWSEVPMCTPAVHGYLGSNPEQWRGPLQQSYIINAHLSRLAGWCYVLQSVAACEVKSIWASAAFPSKRSDEDLLGKDERKEGQWMLGSAAYYNNGSAVTDIYSSWTLSECLDGYARNFTIYGNSLITFKIPKKWIFGQLRRLFWTNECPFWPSEKFETNSGAFLALANSNLTKLRTVVNPNGNPRTHFWWLIRQPT